ncbi:ATP-binding protein [Dechloromonas sp. XY25]|uniref:histidine kinase n=1 Tax=Dechloromonas hankyongensis TaxID=2908002 RepID=A0ABS9K5V9_9RHOO|nr:sensor histidine kinase [Dechloromonas hankyongensis]MCG2578565.1 ATP-binding protein [Dechloromonas hankyongensis]
MKAFRSLHSKILFGYSAVGALFVVLVVSALVQFRLLKDELAKQKEVTTFYDELRNARRLEKNFLLYEKVTDLEAAIVQGSAALLAFDRVRSIPLAISADEASSVGSYINCLHDLLNGAQNESMTQALTDQAFQTGSKALRLGERLNQEAQEQVEAALQRHDAYLVHTIWASLALGLIAGLLVTRSVVRPLREIETSLSKVARGEVGRVDGKDTGDEVESLARSINNTLRELETRQASLARSSRLVALGTMLSGVAHELNNPLSNISSSCQILQEEWSELPEQQTRLLLGQIDDQVMRSQRIVSSLLDFAGSSTLHVVSRNVLELVNESLALLRNALPARISLSIDIDAQLSIDVDPPRFQQVLINVIKNAVDAIPGDGRIAIRAWREEFPEGHGITLEIEDSGSGIPGDILPRIFDPFFTTKQVGKGTGLGLFVTHEIVSLHGGIISAEAVTTGGTRLWMHIPDNPNAEGEKA